MTKEQATIKIVSAIRSAVKNGFMVVVAGDSEGNSFNRPYHLSKLTYETEFLPYGDTKHNVIALGVVAAIDESDIFNY